MSRTFDLSVYFVADPSLCGGRDIVDVVKAAISGGATIVQLRNKLGTSLEVLEQAKDLRKAIKGVPFLINDRVDIAIECGADGVHIGQSDMHVAEARQLLGMDKIIGVTAFTEKHFAVINPQIVDYTGTGPFYETKTDKGKPVLGAGRFRELAGLSPVPVVGIGGIAPGNVRAVIEAGADGVAAMRSISMAADVKKATQALAAEVAAARMRRAS